MAGLNNLSRIRIFVNTIWEQTKRTFDCQAFWRVSEYLGTISLQEMFADHDHVIYFETPLYPNPSFSQEIEDMFQETQEYSRPRLEAVANIPGFQQMILQNMEEINPLRNQIPSQENTPDTLQLDGEVENISTQSQGNEEYVNKQKSEVVYDGHQETTYEICHICQIEKCCYLLSCCDYKQNICPECFISMIIYKLKTSGMIHQNAIHLEILGVYLIKNYIVNCPYFRSLIRLPKDCEENPSVLKSFKKVLWRELYKSNE